MNNAAAPYELGLLEDLADPEEAMAYLAAALEDGDPEIFFLALRDVAEVRGVAQVAGQAQLNRECLCRMLSLADDPQLISLNALWQSVGLRLAVEADQRQPAGLAVAEAHVEYQLKAD